MRNWERDLEILAAAIGDANGERDAARRELAALKERVELLDAIQVAAYRHVIMHPLDVPPALCLAVEAYRKKYHGEKL